MFSESVFCRRLLPVSAASRRLIIREGWQMFLLFGDKPDTKVVDYFVAEGGCCGAIVMESLKMCA